MFVFFLLIITKSDDNLKFSSFSQMLPVSAKCGNKAEIHTKNFTESYY